MRGYAIKELHVAGWVEKDKPEIGPLDALVRPLLLSPCTSDIHSLHGGSGPMPSGRIMGHEAVGEVVEVGSGVSRIKVGDICAVPAATPDWLAPGMQTAFTAHDNGPLKSFKFLSQKDGTMAEFFHVNQADANLALIPEGVSYEAALMTVDMMTTGFWGAEMAEVKFGDTVVVMGIGPVGLMAVAGTQLMGAGRIIGVGTRPNCVALAKEYGASDIISYKDGDLVEQVMNMTDGQGADCVIIAGGNAKTFQQAIQMTRAMGHIANINYFDATEKLCFDAPDWGLGMADKTIRGGFCPGGRVRIERLLSLIKYGRNDPSKLLTHKFDGFDKLPEACKLMEEKPKDLIKPVVYVK